MTRQQVRDQIRKRLGETTASFWTDAELNGWIDDACHEIAYRTKCIKTDGYLTTTSAGEYTLSSTFPNWVAVFKVYLLEEGETWIKLMQTDETRLDREADGWRSADAATPNKYYQDKERDLLGLYPTPDSDNQGTDYLRIYYADDYTNITNDSLDMYAAHIPFFLQRAVADFVVATGYETRGWGDKANDAWQKYESKVTRYLIERDTEKHEDEEALLMKPYRRP